MITTELCLRDLIVNIYRAIRPEPNSNEPKPTYMKPIVEYMCGYKQSEIYAALDELVYKRIVFSCYDNDKNDIIVNDFTEKDYNEYRNLFAMVDKNDFNL